jgi:hypothetical protein
MTPSHIGGPSALLILLALVAAFFAAITGHQSTKPPSPRFDCPPTPAVCRFVAIGRQA